MKNIKLIVLGLLLLTNIHSLILMLVDKRKAIKSKDRIPEGVLFFHSICFGGIGILLGMMSFRHKIRKWYFVIGVPFTILSNMAVIYTGYVLLIKMGVK